MKDKAFSTFFNPFNKTTEGLISPDDEKGWGELLEMATRARQLPVLAKRLKKFDISAAIKEKLTLARNRSVVISAIHEELIWKIDHGFAENGIKFQVLKGVAWNRLFHDKIGLRETGDLDLLVKAEDLKDVEMCLNKLGYFREAGAIDELYEINSYHITFLNNNAIPPIIEAHWALCRPDYYPIPTELFWETPQQVVLFNNTRVMTLSPEFTLILMLLHLVDHNFLLPYSLIDLLYGWFLYKDRIDFDVWQKMLKDFGMMGTTITAFAYMERTFGVKSPFKVDVKWSQRPARKHFSTQPWSKEKKGFVPKLFTRLLVDHKKNVVVSLFRTFFPSLQLINKLYSNNDGKPQSLYSRHLKHLCFRIRR